MSESKFAWDDSALIPTTIDIDFASLLTGKDAADAKVTFHEFPRSELVAFMEESLEKKIYVPDPTGKLEEDGSVAMIKLPFKDVESDHSAFLFKYLSIGCRGQRKAAWFEKLPLTISGITALVDMLLKLNHIEEVMASQGNFMMLPTLRDLFGAANARNSEAPAPTLEA